MRRVAGALLALLVAAPAGCSEARTSAEPAAAPRDASARRNVLLVCLDTVRADRLGCYGYGARPTTPALDALAARSTLFRDASAAAGWTKPSVPTFLTGTYPCQHGVYEGSARALAGTITHVLPEAAGTLAEGFRAAGFATGAILHNAQLARGGGFEQGFDTYDDEAGDARDIRARATRWLDAHADGPFFLYLHLLDVHWPYDIPDDAARRFTAGDVDYFRAGDSRALRDAINDGEVVLDEAQRETLSALYDAALRFADDELGALLADLERRGLAQETVVCVVADHGEEFLEHGRIGHGHGVWQNLLSVPWILHVPGRTPGVVTTPVSLIDLPATLRAAAGLPAGDADEGLDRLALPDRPALLLAEHKAPDRYVQSLRDAHHKLVRDWQPPARAAEGEDLAAAAALLVPGTRWEAELRVQPDGAWRATQLKPRDEPATDPLELKARLADLRDGAFTLAGLPVRLLDGASWSGEAALAQAGPREGALVKARGRVEDGTLLCDRLKFYAEEPGPPEARGTVEAFEADGRVKLSGVWIGVDEETAWKNVALPQGLSVQEPAFGREELAEALQLGAEDAVRAGWRVDCTLYDLAADPGEQRPVARWSGLPGPETPADIRRLSAAADALVRELLGRRTWQAGDETTLGDAALDDLRQIGYVK